MNRLQYIAENLDKMLIGADEPFKFNCTMCGKCCINREDILLKPKDLFNAAKELGLKPNEFLEKYCDYYVGESSRMPIVRLKPVGPTKRCPLLKGNRCSVHNVKPEVCAIFPIGRCISIQDKAVENREWSVNDIQFINQDANCGDKKATHTVREWFAKFNIPVEDEYFIAWNKTLATISMIIHRLEKNVPGEVMASIFNDLLIILYLDYDTEKDFMEQFQVNAQKATSAVKNFETVVDKLLEDYEGGNQ